MKTFCSLKNFAWILFFVTSAKIKAFTMEEVTQNTCCFTHFTQW